MKDYIYNLGARGLKILGQLVLLLVLSRYYGETMTGQVTLAFAVGSILSTVMQLSASSLISSNFHSKPLKSFLVTAFVGLLLSLLFITIIFQFIFTEYNYNILIISALIKIFDGYLETMYAIFRRLNESCYIFTSNALRLVIILIISYFVIIKSIRIELFLISYTLLSIGVFLAFDSRISMKIFRIQPWNTSLKHLSLYKNTAQQAYGMVLGSLLYPIVTMCPRFFLEAFDSVESVGFYAIISNFYILATTLFSIVIQVYMSKSSSKKDFTKKYSSYLRKIFLIIFVLFSSGFIILSVFGEYMLSLFSITSDDKIINYVLLLYSTSIFLAARELLRGVVLFFRQTSIVLYTAILTSIIAIIVHIHLIPQLGLKGAILGTFITAVSSLFFMICFSKKFICRSPLQC